MSIKQFIAGFALEKASQIKESKKDILDTINTRLSTKLANLQEKNKQFISMSSDAYKRLEQVKPYAKTYSLNAAELAIVAMDQDLTNRVIKNGSRPFVAEKIKELGSLFKRPSGKEPGMTADQYIDIYTKKRLKTIYPNQNFIFSDIENMAGLGTRGFTQRKIEKAQAQADYAKSLYAFNQTTPSDVTMKNFTLRPEVFTDPVKAVNETKSNLLLKNNKLIKELATEKDPKKINNIQQKIASNKTEILSLIVDKRGDRGYSFNDIGTLFRITQATVGSKLLKKYGARKLYQNPEGRWMTADKQIANIISNQTYKSVRDALFQTFELSNIKSSNQISNKVITDLLNTAAAYGKQISVDEIKDDFDEYIKDRTRPLDVPDSLDNNNNLTPSNNNNVQSGSTKSTNKRKVTTVNLVPLQNVINKYKTKKNSRGKLLFPELENPEYLKDKQKLLDFFTKKFELGIISSRELLDIEDSLK